ncbi:hypothetical protein MRBLWO14_000996 [Microbacterium sp. LWO14-1.2]|uniref:hypothetical protein n=1 Tax=Microbacterium sp. LWO14-1.2 TaxID=3135263 RepID=UPI00313A4C6E
MTLTRSLPTQHASGITILDERRIVAGRYARNADGTPRVGVLPVHTGPLVTGRASMGYDVAAFNAVSARTTAGAEEVANDGTVTVATTAAPGSNTRLDVIWFHARFSSPVAADTNNDVVFGVTQGTPAAVSPSKPAIPAGAVELAVAEIPSTATTTQSAGVVITQTFQYTAAAGAPVLFRTKTELDAWAAPVGATARTIDSDLEWVRRSTPTPGWYLTPGQRLAYMTGSTTSGVANTVLGSVIRTIALPIGQRVRVRSARVGMYNTVAGGATYAMQLRNNAADVTASVFDKSIPGRAYQPGGSQVVSVPGCDTEHVTTVAAPVSAALFVTASISFGGDGQELWIESL